MDVDELEKLYGFDSSFEGMDDVDADDEADNIQLEDDRPLGDGSEADSKADDDA